MARHLSLEKRTESLLVGRDKTLRTIQYFSRFLAWYLYRTNHPQSTVNVFDNVKKNFSNVRKCLRLGKFVEHFKAAALAADSKSLDPVLKYLAVGRQLGYAFYMTFDAMTYIDQVGIRKFEGAVKLQREAYRAWLAGLLCNIVAGVYTLYNMQQAVKKQQASADAEKAVELKKLEKCVNIFSEGNITDKLTVSIGTELQLSCSWFRTCAMPQCLAAGSATQTSTMGSLVWLAQRAV